jgi:hypothetical protein
MKELRSLINVKTLVTLPTTGALIYGFVVGLIDPKDFMMIALLVIGFYFQKEKSNPTPPVV